MLRALFVIAWLAATSVIVAVTFRSSEPDAVEGFVRSGEVLVEVEAPVILLPEADGGILLGERSTGRILRVDPDGALVEDPVATVEVPSGGVGLMGLAHDGEGRVFASWIDPEGRLVVGRIGDEGAGVIWRGPRMPSTDSGGRLTRLPDGRLLVAVAHVGDPEEVAEPNGRLLSLDPRAGPEQEPGVVASGLTSPTALAADESGVVWVANEEAIGEPQAIVGVSPEGDTATVATLPEGARALDLTLQGDRLYACGSDGLLFGYRLEDLDGAAEPEPVASDCALSVAPLEAGILVYSSHTSIRTILP